MTMTGRRTCKIRDVVSHIVVERDTHTACAMVASGAWAFAHDSTPLTKLTAEDGPPPGATATNRHAPAGRMGAQAREAQPYPHPPRRIRLRLQQNAQKSHAHSETTRGDANHVGS